MQLAMQQEPGPFDTNWVPSPNASTPDQVVMHIDRLKVLRDAVLLGLAAQAGADQHRFAAGMERRLKVAHLVADAETALAQGASSEELIDLLREASGKRR